MDWCRERKDDPKFWVGLFEYPAVQKRLERLAPDAVCTLPSLAHSLHPLRLDRNNFLKFRLRVNEEGRVVLDLDTPSLTPALSIQCHLSQYFNELEFRDIPSVPMRRSGPYDARSRNPTRNYLFRFRKGRRTIPRPALFAAPPWSIAGTGAARRTTTYGSAFATLQTAPP